jgi:hypothetical protein
LSPTVDCALLINPSGRQKLLTYLGFLFSMSVWFGTDFDAEGRAEVCSVLR